MMKLIKKLLMLLKRKEDLSFVANQMRIKKLMEEM